MYKSGFINGGLRYNGGVIKEPNRCYSDGIFGIDPMSRETSNEVGNKMEKERHKDQKQRKKRGTWLNNRKDKTTRPFNPFSQYPHSPTFESYPPQPGSSSDPSPLQGPSSSAPKSASWLGHWEQPELRGSAWRASSSLPDCPIEPLLMPFDISWSASRWEMVGTEEVGGNFFFRICDQTIV